MSKLLRTIRRLRHPRDLWLFLQILFILISLPRKIRLSPLPELLHDLDPGVANTERDDIKMRKTVGFIDSLLKYRIFQRYGKCLLRSLVLFRFLRLQGWPIEIHFGVRKMGGPEPTLGVERVNIEDRCRSEKLDTEIGITGHSWLVLDGEPFVEAEHLNLYSTTYVYPSNKDHVQT